MKTLGWMLAAIGIGAFSGLILKISHPETPDYFVLAMILIIANMYNAAR